MRKRSYKTQKLYAWKAFSKYIRLRDSNSYGIGECISCKRKTHWKEMQAGHLISGRCNNILFDEELVYLQCARCNNNSGEQAKMWINLKEKFGWDDNKFDEFNARKNKILKFSQAELANIEEHYIDMVVGESIKKGVIDG